MKGLTIFIVIAGIFTGLALSLRPWQDFNEQRQKRDQARLEMRQAEKARSELLERSSRLSTPMGMEEAARSRGYVKPGEQKIEL